MESLIYEKNYHTSIWTCTRSFFRYTTRKIARKLGLTGIVKNSLDGSVYIEAEGPEDKLTELLKFAKKGPKSAEVKNIEYEYKEAQYEFKGFEYSF